MNEEPDRECQYYLKYLNFVARGICMININDCLNPRDENCLIRINFKLRDEPTIPRELYE